MRFKQESPETIQSFLDVITLDPAKKVEPDTAWEITALTVWKE